MSWKKTFYEGLKSGIPIGLGYLPVSFTFGFLAVSGGLPVWVAVFISLTNLTSAGQFAGRNRFSLRVSTVNSTSLWLVLFLLTQESW